MTSIALFKFNLITLEKFQIRTNIIKTEEIEYLPRMFKTPEFGIAGVAFSDYENDRDIQTFSNKDEYSWIERQHVLLICSNYKSVTMRKVNDLYTNLLYVESGSELRWSLSMNHDDDVKKNFYSFTIGGLKHLETF